MLLISISLAWLLGIFLSAKFDIPEYLIFVVLLPLSLIFILKKYWKHLVFIAILLFTFWGSVFYYPTTLPDNSLESLNYKEVAQMKGEIINQPEARDQYTQIELNVNEVQIDSGWSIHTGKILVFVPRYPEYKFGDKLLISGKLEKPPTFNDFDYQAYLAQKDIYFTIYSPQVVILENASRRNFKNYIFDIRNLLSQSLAAALPEPQASLAQGIVLGIRSTIPDSLKTNLSITGTAHLLAISGVNLSIVAGILVSLGLWIFGRRHYIYIWLDLFMVWFYLILTGIQAPVFRAAIMASIFLLAELLGRQKSAFAALCLSAAIMVGINPGTLFEVSFQLSFAAMIGLICISPFLQEFIRNLIIRTLGENGFKVKAFIFISVSFCVTIGAIIAIWPIIALNFNILSIIGPLSTLLIAPVLAPIIILGSVTSLIGLFSPPLAQGMGWITWLFLSYMLCLVNFFARFPLAAVPIGKINFNVIWLYYSFLALAILIKENIMQFKIFVPNILKPTIEGINQSSLRFAGLPKKYIIIPLLIIAVLTTCTAVNLPDRNLHVSFLDVGEGDAILIQDGYQNILIDGGPSPQDVCLGMSQKLPFWNRKIDLIILSHPHLDHINGLIEVLNRYEVKQILIPNLVSSSPMFLEFMNLITPKSIPCTLAKSGQMIHMANNTELEILNPVDDLPSETASDMENKGVVARLDKGEISFLFTADIGDLTENSLIEQRVNLTATVLKVAHHGSNTSSTSEFLGVTKPQIGVISTSVDNNFGHPDEEVITRLTSILTSVKNIYRTDRSGTIEFTTDGQTLRVKTE